MEDENWNEIFDSILEAGGGKSFSQSLLDANFDINSCNIQGETALSYASELGILEIVEFLVQKGADSDVKNSDGSKPLHIAAKYGHKNIVEFFLKLGVFVDSCDDYHCTSLHYVAIESYYNDTLSETYLEIANLLVVNGADLNAVNQDGCTPLLLAAQNSNKALIELFINLGANVKCCNQDQFTVLHHASQSGWIKIVHFLMKRGSDFDINSEATGGYTPLLLAAQNSHEAIVKLLINLGADVKCYDEDKFTVLHHASQNGWLEIVQSIMKKKSDVDINARTTSGFTPLILAAKHSHEDVVKLLIESGANIKCQGNDTRTLMHCVAQKGWIDVMKSLVNQGCDVNSTTSLGLTPALLAAMGSHFDVVEYLIESGADVKCCSKDEYTLLHYASKGGCLEVVESLIRKGCNVNAKTYCGVTPLSAATQADRLDVMNYLLKAGADFNIVTYYQSTALSYLLKRYPHEVKFIKLFVEYGAYLHYVDFLTIMDCPYLKKFILNDVKLCTQIAMNNFNNAVLTRFSEIAVAEKLPPIEIVKIFCNKSLEQDIQLSVMNDMQMNGYCNVLDVRPTKLNCLCVMSFVENYYSQCFKVKHNKLFFQKQANK